MEGCFCGEILGQSIKGMPPPEQGYGSLCQDVVIGDGGIGCALGGEGSHLQRWFLGA